MPSYFFILAISLLNACISSLGPETQYPLKAYEDRTYAAAYGAASQQFDLVHNFETKFKISLTHVTPAFRQAINKRSQEIWDEPIALLDGARNKTAFFLSIYAANIDMENLNNADLWNIQLKTAGQIFKPTSMNRLTQKDRWQLFFPEVNPWSIEYLLVFDQIPDSSAEKSELILSSPDGTLKTEW